MNKKIVYSFVFFLLILSFVSNGQMRSAFHVATEGFVDFDVKYGAMTDKYSLAKLSQPYPNAVDLYKGTTSLSNVKSYGFDAKVGYFLNDKKSLAIVIGLSYLYQSGSLSMDTFHVEYMATDTKNRIYRQMVSLSGLSETAKFNNINVPFLIHYQKKYSQEMFLSFDGGFLYNVQYSAKYSASGLANYEAIYDYNVKTKSFVYNNSSVAQGTGVIPITIKQYYLSNPKGSDIGLNQYMTNFRQQWGANVGVGNPITQKTGSVNFKNGSLGLILEPDFNYQLNDNMFLKFGVFYMYQYVQSQGTKSDQAFMGKTFGSYNGLISEMKNLTTSGFGVDVGIRIILKDKIEEGINYITQW